MLKFVVFVTVISAVIIDNIESQPLQDLDIQSFLQSLQQQLQKEQLSKGVLEVNNLKDEEDDDDEESHFGSLKNEQLEKLVAFVPNKDNRQKNWKRYPRNKDLTNSQLTSKILEQLLDQGRLNMKSQKKGNLDLTKSRLQPIDLLDPQSVKNLDKDYVDDSPDLSEYSKVYVILNPDTLKLSKNRNKLKDLLSALLYRPHSEKEQRLKKMEHRYKGFLVKDDYEKARRINRDYRDDYMDMDNTPKRARYNRGGGRGGGARGGSRGGRGRGRDSDLRSGHTAIPYINHHVGNIYERDD